MKTEKSFGCKARLCAFAIAASLSIFGAQAAEPNTETRVEKTQETNEQALFPGGQKRFKHFITKNLRYPRRAQKNYIKGRVDVSFTVDEEGNVTDIQVEKGVHKTLDKEAIRLVKSMPTWSPAKENGKPIATRMVLPVMFRL